MRTLTRITLAAFVAAAVPALAAAQSGSSADSAGRHDMGMRGTRQGVHGAMGGSMGLTSDQIMELQQGLASAGCDAGTADGRIGPKTHRALQCAAQKNNVTSGNVNELFRAMNLSFTATDSMPMNHAGMRGNMNGSMSNSTNRNRNGMRNGRMRDSSGMSGRDSSSTGSSADSSRSKPPRR